MAGLRKVYKDEETGTKAFQPKPFWQKPFSAGPLSVEDSEMFNERIHGVSG